jgi:hypothetical protein
LYEYVLALAGTILGSHTEMLIPFASKKLCRLNHHPS